MAGTSEMDSASEITDGMLIIDCTMPLKMPKLLVASACV
jgi:hypothetical protein